LNPVVGASTRNFAKVPTLHKAIPRTGRSFSLIEMGQERKVNQPSNLHASLSVRLEIFVTSAEAEGSLSASALQVWYPGRENPWSNVPQAEGNELLAIRSRRFPP
jgi:hypothetical protein